MLGTILGRSTISVTASMPENMYLGSWRLGSHLMMIRSKAFLIIAMRYRTENGIPRTLPISNIIVFMPSMLILIGIPGLESVQCWIGIPFSVLYLIAMIRNALLLIIIK